MKCEQCGSPIEKYYFKKITRYIFYAFLGLIAIGLGMRIAEFIEAC